jgi:hypothetical protein
MNTSDDEKFITYLFKMHGVNWRNFQCWLDGYTVDIHWKSVEALLNSPLARLFRIRFLKRFPGNERITVEFSREEPFMWRGKPNE